jgi:VanZ family protein
MSISASLKQCRPLLAWGPSLLWAVTIIVVSVLPVGITPPLNIAHFDKVCHFFEFSVLAFLLVWGMSRSGMPFGMKNGVFALILSSGYGIVIEILQYFVPGRQADIMDAAGNLAGAVFGIFLGKLVLWRK